MYRHYRVPTVWKEVERLKRDMNQLFEGYSPSRLRRASGYPAMNAWANEDGLTITAEVPGISAEDIDISVIGETMTLSGTRNPDELKEGIRYHRRERGNGDFTRSIHLPFAVKIEDVEATFKNGVLQVNLPRAEEDKPKKIAVKSV